MGLKLDRGRPYGEIYPASRAHYEQDGKTFDRNGDEIEVPAEPVIAAPEEDTVRHIDLRRKENKHLRRPLAA